MGQNTRWGLPFYLEQLKKEVKPKSRWAKADDKESILEFTQAQGFEQRGGIWVLGCIRGFLQIFIWNDTQVVTHSNVIYMSVQANNELSNQIQVLVFDMGCALFKIYSRNYLACVHRQSICVYMTIEIYFVFHKKYVFTNYQLCQLRETS